VVGIEKGAQSKQHNSHQQQTHFSFKLQIIPLLCANFYMISDQLQAYYNKGYFSFLEKKY